MSVFAYAGRAADGRRRRGWIEAETAKSARAALAGQGVLTETLRAAVAHGRLAAAGRARLYRELGALLDAGFPLERALGMLMQEGGATEHDYGFLAGLRDRIRDGESLARALAALTPDLPAFERAAVQAAEHAGLQGEVLAQLADFMESRQAAGERLRAALLYPLVVLGLAMGLLSLMMFVVLPRASRLFEQFGGGVPPQTRWLAAWGPRLLFALLAAVAFGVLAVVAARRAARHDPARAARVDRLASRLPLCGPLLARLWGMHFAHTMALLLKAGVNAQDALASAGMATGSPWMGTLAAEQSERVRHGASLAQAVQALTPLAPFLFEWVRVGESAGNLHAMLSQAAQRCQRDVDRRLTRHLALLEPLLILLIGGIVLIVAYSVLKPMLDLARAAANL